MSKWTVLILLSMAQFLMVLDSAVMNVSISQLVEDFNTDVTTIQFVITFYALVMAALMITGGKLGDLWGRRRAFMIGHGIYAVGSLITALSWSVPALLVGWSVIEGVGAALVLPAIAALAAGTYQGRDRAAAYGVLGGVAGVGIAVGPILGGWVTTYLTWRLVFAGEVVVAIITIIGTIFAIREPARTARAPQLDWIGAVLSAVGLSLIVYGVLQASTWGWLHPLNSPIEPFGFSLTPFVVAAGFLVLAVFRWWQGYLEARQKDPLVHFRLFLVAPLRAGLTMLLAQNVILMGIFFTIPLYLQVAQGYNAFETGVRMLPISVTLFISALGGSALAARYSARLIVRVGLGFLLLASLLLLLSVTPEIDTVQFAISSGVFGLGMGLVSSQLGNVVQSAVGENDRSEAGGLQYTAQQLGSSLGTALIGAIVISALAATFGTNVAQNPDIAPAVQSEVGIRLEAGLTFVPADDVRSAAQQAGLDEGTTDAIVDDYEEGQLTALRTGLLAAGFIALASFLFTGNLPSKRFDELAGESGDSAGSQQSTAAPA